MADTDGWNGPRRHDEAGLGRLMNEIATLKRQVAELQRGAPLRAAGIGASPEGLTVHSSLNVDGSLAATGDTTIGGTLDVGADTTISGNTELGGNLGVTGDLQVRDGGRIALLYPNSNQSAVFMGDIYADEGAGPYVGTGLLVEDETGADLISAQGDGITSPAFTIHCGPDDYSVWPGTSSGSWATIYEGAARVYSPGLRFVAKVSTDASDTSGDVRLLVRHNDVDYILDTVNGVGFGYAYPEYNGPRPAQISTGGYMYVRLQARRTAGTGSVRGTILQAVLQA